MLLTNVVRMLARYQKSPQRCTVEGFCFAPKGFTCCDCLANTQTVLLEYQPTTAEKNVVSMISATVSPPFSKIRGLVYHIRIPLTLSNAPKSPVFAFSSLLVYLPYPLKTNENRAILVSLRMIKPL